MLNAIRKNLGGLALVATLAAPGFAAAAGPADVRFAAAPTGSTWYAYAGAFRAAALEALPRGSAIEIMNTPMAIANTKLIEGDRADMGMIFPPVARWAVEAFGPFDNKVDNVRGIVGGMDEYFQRITVQKNFPLESLADIKEKKIAVRIGTGPQGSLNEYIARLILAANDLTYADIEKLGGSVMMNGFDVLRNEFGDGRIDMIIGITTEGHPNTAQLSIAPGHRFLSLSDNAVKYLEQYGFQAATMPANMFEGQSEPVVGVGFPTSLYVSSSMSDDHAYLITKGIMEARESLMRQFGSMRNWKAEDSATFDSLQMPLHPGAERYYREVGLLK
jgi:TRAP transporter TAXI family solute receptor